ncbi:hypothetical protein H4S08_000025 [Coemansia sp. RSA 1365]|nr:hypothetical protein H4S08_000025 [Coemansia sp. RSA 1365]
MFIVDICRQKMQGLKQRRGTKRARMAAAAKRVVHFVLCSTDVPTEAVERPFDNAQVASKVEPLVDVKPEAPVVATNVADVQLCTALDATMDIAENYIAPNPGMLAAEEEIKSMINIITDEDRFDAVPICATPRLSLFGSSSDFNHGEVADLKDLAECLDAICDADISIDNVCSSESSVCVALDMLSNMAMSDSDDLAEPMSDITDIFAGNSYFDEAPIDVMPYQSLNAIASNFNKNNSGDYHDSDNSDVNIENDCSNVSSTYVMSDGVSDISKADEFNAEKQLVLALAKAMDEQFFGRSLMEDFNLPNPSPQGGAEKAMSSVTVEIPMAAGSIKHAGWTHDLPAWIFSAASTVAHAFRVNAN